MDARVEQNSQSDEAPYKIILKDSSELIGEILDRNEERIVFKTLSGIQIDIPREKIKLIKRLPGKVINGSYVRTDPNNSRLFVTATARPLRHGQGYASISEIFFPMVGIGLGDVFSPASGISLFPFSDSQIYYLAPKITPFQWENVNIAAGLLHFGVSRDAEEGLGLIYGVSTFDIDQAAVTVGLGWGYAGNNTADGRG